MDRKLAVIVLGKRNAGKSTTWYTLFGRTLRSGRKSLPLYKAHVGVYLKNGSPEESGISIEVALRNSSFEESWGSAENYFGYDDLPLIVLCSVQYIQRGHITIDWFIENGYELYVHWLSPGHKDQQPYVDHLQFGEKIQQVGSFLQRNGNEVSDRAEELRDYIAQWVSASHKKSA